ncbi:MAG: hypothetical protein P8Y64_11460 [Gammaproteobacteria bacterium]|jgi:hypothetical protein
MDTLTSLKEAFENNRIGEGDLEIPLSDTAENRYASQQIMTQARRSMLIVSRQLDPLLYDTEEFVQAASDFARRNRYTRIYILIRDNSAILRDGHRLITLAQRISSHIQVRLMHENYGQYNQAFMVADKRGILIRPKADQMTGRVIFNDPRLGSSLEEVFMEMWESSLPDPNLRRLMI